MCRKCEGMPCYWKTEHVGNLCFGSVVVFITVLVLNISITSGGFILFNQLLDTFDIDASGTISYLKSAKHAISAWIQ